MIKLLIDENISPLSAELFKQAGFQVVLIRDILQGRTDREIYQKAVNEDYIIITLDLDFGYIYTHTSDIKPTIIVLRPGHSFTIETVNNLIKKVIDSNILIDKNIKSNLVVITPKKIRIYK